jgi:hypothetical protein
VEIFLGYAVVLGIPAAIAAVIFFFSKSRQKGRDLFWQMMRDVNAKHGTAFPTDVSGMDLVLSGGGGPALIFDPAARKIYFLTNPSECKGEIIDFDYIRGWSALSDYKFVANTNVYTNARIEFRTNDIRRPTFVIRTGAHSHAQNWDQKLQILFKRN